MGRGVLNPNEIMARFLLKHGEKYDYSKMEYQRIDRKVEIVCPEHGSFFQTPYNHFKSGCNMCSRIEKSKKYGGGIDIFLKKAREIHESKYDYSLVDLISVKNKIIIICPEHGIYEQVAESHLAGCGCPTCAGKTPLTTKKIIDRFKEIHGNRYDYSEVEYQGWNIKVKISCVEHGMFEQTMSNHYAGNGCPKCSKKFGIKENLWLDSLGVPKETGTRQVRILLKAGNTIVADGYDPETKTVYEFWGDRWHGNPNKYKLDDINPITKKSYNTHYQETLSKIRSIKESGYNLIDIWETQWDNIIRNQDWV